MEAEDWIYGDGEHELAAGYRKKLAELRTTGNPIARRASELKARPEVRVCKEGLHVGVAGRSWRSCA